MGPKILEIFWAEFLAKMDFLPTSISLLTLKGNTWLRKRAPLAPPIPLTFWGRRKTGAALVTRALPHWRRIGRARDMGLLMAR
jgi:hypothetical protein